MPVSMTTDKQRKKKDPMEAIIEQLEEYDEGTPPRTNIYGTWGE